MTKDDISVFCVDKLAEIMRIPKDTIDVRAKFSRMGLDSASIVFLQIELEDRFQLEIEADTFYDHPTIEALATYLAEKCATRAAV